MRFKDARVSRRVYSSEESRALGVEFQGLRVDLPNMPEAWKTTERSFETPKETRTEDAQGKLVKSPRGTRTTQEIPLGVFPQDQEQREACRSELQSLFAKPAKRSAANAFNGIAPLPFALEINAVLGRVL